MRYFEKWVCKIEKVDSYTKIDMNFSRADTNALEEKWKKGKGDRIKIRMV